VVCGGCLGSFVLHRWEVNVPSVAGCDRRVLSGQRARSGRRKRPVA
jgi:hypothetical protein